MILKGYDGIYTIERSPYHTEEDEARFDRKYGKGNWKFVEPICHGLCPECGYGEPLDESKCFYCDGKCVRPKR